MALDLFKIEMEEQVRKGMEPKMRKLLDAQVEAQQNRTISKFDQILKQKSENLTKLNGRNRGSAANKELKKILIKYQTRKMTDIRKQLDYDPKLRMSREETRFEVCNEIYPDVVKEVTAKIVEQMGKLMTEEYAGMVHAAIDKIAYKKYKEIFANIVSGVSKTDMAKWIENHEAGDFAAPGKVCISPYCSARDKAPVKLPVLEPLKLKISYTISYCVTSSPTFSPSSSPSFSPTSSPTENPTTPKPTTRPTRKPTKSPTQEPTKSPTPRPTNSPTQRPTIVRTKRPTRRPTIVPTTKRPTKRPTIVRTTKRPTRRPTIVRTTKRPTKRPTAAARGL